MLTVRAALQAKAVRVGFIFIAEIYTQHAGAAMRLDGTTIIDIVS